MCYLLAAEADKIQEFIFRSSRLREVVGASQLLTRFCETDAPALLEQYGGNPEADIRVNDGGSFRVVFHAADPERARQRAIDFGDDLAELYRLTVGGSLSVAEPVELDRDFRKCNKEAGKALRRAKEHWRGAVAELHMPYIALCASCGVALAERHDRLPGEPSSASSRYLCQSCQVKASERNRKPRAMLDRFFSAYCNAAGMEQERVREPDWPENADEIAGFDLRGRNYVAYLVADGNNMGRLFGSCGYEQIKEFSAHLPLALATSLAESTATFRKALSHGGAMVPVLPLILGGDDLFALIPAPYALDFARHFCLAYEQEVSKLVREAELDVPQPTVAAAVVICKSKYPYALAHRRAEELMKEAKRQCKLLARHSGESLSAVSFEVILGNRLAGQETEDEERRQAIRTTMRPYWAIEKDKQLSDTAKGYGIGLHQLLAQRLALKDIPNKRLTDLRRLFADLPRDINILNRQQQLEAWTAALDSLIVRAGKGQGKAILESMEALGKPLAGRMWRHHWRDLRRDGQIVLVHGLLDLVETWDFAQDLDHFPEAYEIEEREQ